MIEQRLSLTYSEPTLEEETAFLWGDERSTLQAAALGDITHARHLEVSNCCIRLKEEEANALRETLHAALDRPEVVAVMKAQAWRYGAV